MIESSNTIATNATVLGARGAIDETGFADFGLVKKIIKGKGLCETSNSRFGNDARIGIAGESERAKRVGDEHVREPDVRGEKVGTHVWKDITQIEQIATTHQSDVDELENRIRRFENVMRHRFHATILTQCFVQKRTF